MNQNATESKVKTLEVLTNDNKNRINKYSCCYLSVQMNLTALNLYKIQTTLINVLTEKRLEEFRPLLLFPRHWEG